MGEFHALPGERVRDLHQEIDAAEARGARAAVLLVIEEDGEDWTAIAVGKSSRQERAFCYQQLVLCELTGSGEED